MYKVFIFFNLSYFVGTQKNHLKRLAKQHLTLCTLVHSEDPDEMQHDAAFHQGLHCLLRLKQHSVTEIYHNLENFTCDP